MDQRQNLYIKGKLPMEIFVSIIVAAFLGLIPAYIAKNKGHSFGLWWFYGWMLFIVAIIHVQFIEDYSSTTGGTLNSEVNGKASNRMQPVNNIADELKRLKELQDAGLITEEDFEMKKKQLLGL